uniref:hypothetical protein n=1 Tax=Ningiella ruwaisensis TaxID=2364274 RepID=UPI0010A07945|nr:hypothetical protein [Ningiella ruwaisensis]
MRYESLLNVKEYLHFLFLISVLFGNLLFFDLNDVQDRARSILIVVAVGLVYIAQVDQLKFEYWKWDVEKNPTNYEIVGPFGFVLIAVWIAILDYSTVAVVSKYTGLIIIFTIISALAVTTEIKKRSEERLVSETIINVHKFTVWCFFGLLYLVATRYFLMQGTWEWDLPSVYGVFSDAF